MKTIVLILLLPMAVMAQAANQFRQTTVANLGRPSIPNQVRYAVDARADATTGECLSGGDGLYAYWDITTLKWYCNKGVPSGGGGTGDVSSNTSTSTTGQAAIFSNTTGKQIGRFTSSGWVKATGGILSTVASIDASTDLTGNLPLARFNNGTNASSVTVWCGNGTWCTPAGGGTVTSVSATSGVNGLSFSVSTATSTPSIVMTGVPNINASNVTGGVLNVARLGTGSPSVSTFLRGDGSWAATGSGIGSVTSVALSLPNLFLVSGSPVTTTGTLTATLATQNANQLFAGPTTGSAAAPVFRALVAADIPNLDAAKIATGTIGTARLGSGTANSTTCLRGDQVWATCATGTPAGSVGQFQFNNTTFGGAANFTFTSATGQVTLNQSGNGNNTLYGKRVTDSAPTGNFIQFQNQAASEDLFKVDVSGNVTMKGTLTVNSPNGTEGIFTISSGSGGGVQLTTGTRPTCDSIQRGLIWFTAGSTGVGDTVEICRKNSSEVYGWVALF